MRMGAPYKLAVARFCLLSDVPVFYWLRGTASPDVRQMLTDAFTRRPPGRSEHILQVAMFLGKKFYESLARRIRDRRVLSHNAREYPPSGPRAVFGREPLLQIRRATCKDSDEGLAAYALGELNVIAGRVDGQTVQEPSGEDKWLARIYDCHLYAQDDKYAKSQEDEESPAQSDTVTGA